MEPTISQYALQASDVELELSGEAYNLNLFQELSYTPVYSWGYGLKCLDEVSFLEIKEHLIG